MKTPIGLTHSRRGARWHLILGYGILSLALAGRAPAADIQPADEQELRDLDTQWCAAAVAKDVDKTVSYYSDDAVVFAPNAPSINTKEAIRSAWKEILTSPGSSLSWKTGKVEVSKSGELAYVSGAYDGTMNDASGKPVKDRGKYVEIFRKQPDGSWKCVLDIWNSDLPASVPAEKK